MRKCPLSKTELQKARRMFELTGENRRSRRKRVREALTNTKKTVLAEVTAVVDALAAAAGEKPAAVQTKAEVLREKVDKEFADKPRRKKA